MRKLYFFLLVICMLISVKSFGKATVSGYVRDGATGEALNAANVNNEEHGTGTRTNENVYYEISQQPGK